MPTEDPDHQLTHTIDEMESRIEALDDRIDEARDRLETIQQDNKRLVEGEDIAGDWRDADDDTGGDDPVGAAQ